jgi:copper oxidase (laccase) domain-containing protein
VLQPAGGDQWRFDLWAASRLVLRDAGVQDTNIHVTDVPTGPGAAGLSFFSHRAQQPCGRFAAIARLDRPDRKLHHQKEGR